MTGWHKQRGSTVLEFIPIFLVFFGLFYAIVSYALAMLIQQGLTGAAAEGARAAIRLDPLAYTTLTSYQNAAAALVKTTAGDNLNWLPADARAKVLSGVTVSRTSAGALQVTVKYAGYGQSPMLPVIKLPVVGAIPALPDDLVGQAVVRTN